MAPNKKDLSKIGQEAFALLDGQFYARKGRPCIPSPPPSSHAAKMTNKNYLHYDQYQSQKSNIVQFKPADHQERVINSYEAVQLHGGVLICDYSKRKPKPMPYYY